MDASAIDRPFAAPLDIELDLPVPPSVNRSRRIDWRSRRRYTAWLRQADALLMLARSKPQSPLKAASVPAQWEIHVILSEKHTKMDLDNALKCLQDWLVRVDLVIDDGPKYLRKITMEWGYAPEGCRVIVRPREAN